MNRAKPIQTVLLVDDDPGFVEAHRRLLEGSGYAVHTACGCRECLEEASRHKPDLIVMQMILDREEGGFDLSRQLRNREYTKNIPQVMISTVDEDAPYRFEPDRTWLPVDALIAKPVEPQRLLEVVHRILEAQA